MTFTIVVTVFERPTLVPCILFSVIWQEYSDWELIFVADGRQPEADLIVENFRETVPALAPRIRYVTLPQAPGAWGNLARRYGLEQALGDYTVIVGHDAILFPGFLAAHAENIAEVPGCLSLVDVDCWGTRVWGTPEVMHPHPLYAGVLPRRTHALDALELGEVEVTSMAFPTARARELGVFAADEQLYCADYTNAYLLCNKTLPIVHRPGVVAGHF